MTSTRVPWTVLTLNSERGAYAENRRAMVKNPPAKVAANIESLGAPIPVRHQQEHALVQVRPAYAKQLYAAHSVIHKRLAHGIGSHGKNRGFDHRFGSQRHGQSQIPHDPREG